MKQLMPLAEYLAFDTPEGSKDELIQGELVISSSGKPALALIIKKTVSPPRPARREQRLRSQLRLKHRCRPFGASSMPRPDVFVMERSRFLEAAKRDVFPEGSPELAIEVVSPSNTKRGLLAKLKLYLRRGSSAVWLVFPKTTTPAANIGKVNI